MYSPMVKEPALCKLQRLLQKATNQRDSENIVERFLEPEDQGIWYKIVSPSNVRIYSHKVSSTWTSKLELNEDSNRHAKVDRGNPIGLHPA